MATCWEGYSRALSRVRFLPWVFFIAALLSFFASDAAALPEGLKKGFVYHAMQIKAMEPPYRCDIRIAPHDPYSKGVDCSRLWYLAGVLAGFLGIDRVSAEDMAAGRGGWTHTVIVDWMRDNDEGDLVFFKWTDKLGKPKTRKRVDHVGGLVPDPESGVLVLLHASSGAGKPVLARMQGVFVKDHVKSIRLTIGESGKGGRK